jgi:hypothetical protein
MPTEVKKLRLPTEIAKQAETRREIAARLKRARIDAGFRTASDAARAVSIAGPTYLAHENGTRAVRSVMLEYYANAFRVRVEWLLTGDGEEKSPHESPVVPELKDTLLQLTDHCLQLALKLDEDKVKQLFSLLAALLQFLKKVS